MAIKNSEASQLRTQAKKKRAEKIIKNLPKEDPDRLEAEADLAELIAFEEQGAALIEAAVKERQYIQSLMNEIQPLRKFSHLSNYEAHQAAQEEEWKRELIWRAENFLVSQGTIPYDHLSTMRLHPAWEKELLPQIQEIQGKILHFQKTGQIYLPNHTSSFLELTGPNSKDK